MKSPPILPQRVNLSNFIPPSEEPTPTSLLPTGSGPTPLSLFVSPTTITLQNKTKGLLEYRQTKILEWVAMPSSRGVFLTPESDPNLLCFLHWQEVLYHSCHLGSPFGIFSSIKKGRKDFPIGPVVEDPPCKTGDAGLLRFNPWLGK